MDLLSVLNQRHLEQSSETLNARSQFWRSFVSGAGLLVLATWASPAYQVSHQGTFWGTFLSLVFLLSMAGTYVFVLQSLHSLFTLRLPTPYGEMGLATQIRLLLPADVVGARPVGGVISENASRFDYYGFYLSYFFCIVFGFGQPVFLLFCISLLVFCLTIVRHSIRFYV